MRNKAFICVEHLTKKVSVGSDDLTILEDISLTIDLGETVSILGVSGSGKSTLLGIMAGLDLPSSGKILFDGQVLNQLSEDKRARLRAKNVGFIFQDFQLLPNLTALENVLLPLELNGIKKAKQRANDFLKKVGLADRAVHYPRQLSGGEQQRVAIARAFSTHPRVLFADEPTGNLDQKTAKIVVDLLFEVNQQFDTTLVCVTHDSTLGDRCQRALQLSYGKLV